MTLKIAVQIGSNTRQKQSHWSSAEMAWLKEAYRFNVN
jgi:hypothetical protein